MLVPDSQIDQMGVQAFDQLKSTTPSDQNPADNQYVQCVANAITDAAKGQTSVDRWEVVVFQDATANAFALPGGKIGVHTGMLKVAQNDAQLGAVLGHEVGHVIAKHGAERASNALEQNIALGVVGAAGVSPQLMQVLGVGGQLAFTLPHSRTHESEADLIGLNLMAEAGFDPRQSVELWRNMSKASGGGAPPQWLSTHPANETRIQALQEHLPEAIAKYDQARAQGHAPHCAPPRS